MFVPVVKGSTVVFEGAADDAIGCDAADTTVDKNTVTYNGDQKKYIEIVNKSTKDIKLKKIKLIVPPEGTQSVDWINNSGNTTGAWATETGGDGNKEYTLMYAKSETGKGFSYEIKKIEGMPEGNNPSNVDGGFIEVNCEVAVPSKIEGDMFIDLSGSNTIPGWNPNNSASNQYARFAANSSWNNIHYCGGQNATTQYGYDGAPKVESSDQYVPIKFIIDMTDKDHVVMSYNGDEQVISGFASEIKDKLYLNIQPIDKTGGANNGMTVKVKNISAKYTARQTVTFEEGEAESGYYTVDNKEGEKFGIIRFLQPLDGEITGYGFYFLDASGNIVKTEKRVSKTETLSDGSQGIYADLSGIPETYTPKEKDKPEIKPWEINYQAKAYVVSSDGHIYFGNAISGMVGKEPVWVVNPETEQ